MEYETCARTGKRCYSRVDAQYLCNMATKKHWQYTKKDVPKRSYLCPFCHAYHLTKEKAKYDRNKKRNKLSARHTSERRRIKRMEEVIYRYSREYR